MRTIFAIFVLAFSLQPSALFGQQSSELFALYTLYTPGTNTVSACSASTNYASADIDGGTMWSTNGAATMWDCLDKPRGDTSSGTFIGQFTASSRAAVVLRVTLPGNCNVSAITIYTYGGSAGNDTVDFSVSPDNSTYSSVVAQSYTTSYTERSSVFTSLNWTTPAYCYVKINGNATTDQNVNINNMQVMVNP